MIEVKEIDVDKVTIPDNCRTDTNPDVSMLMESIKSIGLQNPIVVFQKNEKGEYPYCEGFRRLMAFRKLGMKKIRATILDQAYSSKEFLIYNLSENIQRSNISPFEEGRSVYRLMNTEKMNPAEIASRLGILESRVRVALSIFENLPKNYANDITYGSGGTQKAGKIPAHTANAIISSKKTYGLSKKDCADLLDACKDKDLSRRDLDIILLLIKMGFSVKEALEESEKYLAYRLDVVIFSKDLQELKAKYNNKPSTEIFRDIIYGKIPPLKLHTNLAEMNTKL